MYQLFLSKQFGSRRYVCVPVEVSLFIILATVSSGAECTLIHMCMSNPRRIHHLRRPLSPLFRHLNLFGTGSSFVPLLLRLLFWFNIFIAHLIIGYFTSRHWTTCSGDRQWCDRVNSEKRNEPTAEKQSWLPCTIHDIDCNYPWVLSLRLRKSPCPKQVHTKSYVSS